MPESNTPLPGSTPRLTPAQADLLREFAEGEHYDRYVTPKYRRTAEVLRRHGYLSHSPGRGWYVITPTGRAAHDAR